MKQQLRLNNQGLHIKVVFSRNLAHSPRNYMDTK